MLTTVPQQKSLTPAQSVLRLHCIAISVPSQGPVQRPPEPACEKQQVPPALQPLGCGGQKSLSEVAIAHGFLLAQLLADLHAAVGP